MNDAKARNCVIIARLKPGVSRRQAQAAIDTFTPALLTQFPRPDKENYLKVSQLRSPGMFNDATGSNPLPRVAALFLSLAIMVLALACINVANLTLARSAGRQREMAVRSALGAGRLRLVQQWLTESLLLALLGCAGGVFVGYAVSRAIGSIPIATQVTMVLDFHFDWRVFVFSLAITTLAAILSGIFPALRASRANMNEVLHESARTMTGPKSRLRSILVVAEVGGALALLIVAGLFVKSLGIAARAKLGFAPDHVLNLRVEPAEIGYTQAQTEAFHQAMLERVRALPGVDSASLALMAPLADNVLGSGVLVSGQTLPPGENAPYADFNAVSPGHFTTLQTPLLSGRDFTSGDSAGAPRVAIINQAMAEKFWPNQDLLGKQFARPKDPNTAITVVGVAGNSRIGGLYGPFNECFYVPLAQNYNSAVTLQVRAAGAPESMALPATGAIHAIESTMPVTGVETMRQAVSGVNGLLLFELGGGLAGAMGLLGLVLAIVGVYGVIAFTVSQRTHEIGIRMALGAQPGQILKLMFRHGLILTAVGLILGLLLASAGGQFVEEYLSGLSPRDPGTFFLVSSLLLVVALLACWIPARRAMKVDPLVALRHE
ncbi:MAG: FtsX-like permease family protein [Candidatus Acidiferrales bacterium]